MSCTLTSSVLPEGASSYQLFLSRMLLKHGDIFYSDVTSRSDVVNRGNVFVLNYCVCYAYMISHSK